MTRRRRRKLPGAGLRDKVEHLVHKRDGTIGERNSYGNDPSASKG